MSSNNLHLMLFSRIQRTLTALSIQLRCTNGRKTTASIFLVDVFGIRLITHGRFGRVTESVTVQGSPNNTQHLTENVRKRTNWGLKRSACPMRTGIQAVRKDNTSRFWKIIRTARSTQHKIAVEPVVDLVAVNAIVNEISTKTNTKAGRNVDDG
ncbi:hypothetical protein F444_11777 [Phytophthora nicotianae P1976]|uniref:Uncharacterized protein n=1 Tax=Phytophthora nicotianae P1976 TaxID=1317066 RepID=A0A080ZZD8_PHYNI|nr:hypothetical protein F444_11777 [Phytophthora nicotianae P1976]